MVSDGELDYFDSIGESGRRHALNKPWSDEDRSGLLAQVGGVLSVLPRPPARVLDCGCGTGWLTWLLQHSGYDAVGVDVADRAIELATEFTERAAASTQGFVSAPEFLVAPVEDLGRHDEFDAVLFFDSLHHSLDETAALRSAHAALKRGGLLVTSEPGRGHAERSRGTVETFGVTERDMPARHIREVGERVGFEHVATLPRLDEVDRLFAQRLSEPQSLRNKLTSSLPGRMLRLLRLTELAPANDGIVVLRKADR